MAFPFPTPRLIKLRPVPAWSLRPPVPDPAALAATPRRPIMMDAGLTAVPAAWGTCEIVLVAERGRGATHKFFHDWRFEAVMRHGEPEPRTVLAVSPITPRRRETVAAVADPVSLLEQFHAGAPNPPAPRQATFTWTLPPNQADRDPDQPLVLALTRLRQRLRAAGWQSEDGASPRYRKSAPASQAVGGFTSPDPDRTVPGSAPIGASDGLV